MNQWIFVNVINQVHAHMYLYIYIILYQFVAILRVTFPIDSQGHKSRVDNVCQSRVGINAVTCNDWCSILAPKKRRRWSSSPGSRLLLQRSHFVNPLLLLPSPWPQRKTRDICNLDQPWSTENPNGSLIQTSIAASLSRWIWDTIPWSSAVSQRCKSM